METIRVLGRCVYLPASILSSSYSVRIPNCSVLFTIVPVDLSKIILLRQKTTVVTSQIPRRRQRFIKVFDKVNQSLLVDGLQNCDFGLSSFFLNSYEVSSRCSTFLKLFRLVILRLRDFFNRVYLQCYGFFSKFYAPRSGVEFSRLLRVSFHNQSLQISQKLQFFQRMLHWSCKQST